MKARPLYLALLVAVLGGCQSNSTLQPKPPEQPVLAFSNQDWAKVLDKVATPDGYVKWDLLQSDQETRDALARYLGLLSVCSPRNQSSLFVSPNDIKAYWINAYNALSLYWVICHQYPATIPAHREGKFEIGGEKMSLADVDAQLRNDFADRMVIFALNGCALSDPPLRQTPYDGAVLDAQLLDQAHLYLNDPRGVRRDGNTLDLALPLLAFVSQTSVSQAIGATPRDLEHLRPLATADSPLQSASDVTSVQFVFDYSLNRPPR